MYNIYLILSFLFISQIALAQKSMSITTFPTDAEIYLKSNSKEEKIGKGNAIFPMEKDKLYVIIVRKEGYVDVQRSYTRKKEGAITDKIELEDRVIKVNATPSDAKIFINGNEVKQSSYSIIIPKGQSVTIDVKKTGFVPISKTFYNKEGQAPPEISTLIKLEDRIISIKTQPTDAEIFVDDIKKGEGSTDIVIPLEKCITVKVKKNGYVSSEETFCNKETEATIPLSREIKLKERLVQINTSTEDAKIFVDGKELGKGSYAVKIPENKCTEVEVKKESYITQKLVLCNKIDYQQPEPVYAIKMIEDDAFRESEQSNIANINFSVEVSPQLSRQEAWQTLASIIQGKFDEIESIDANTIYLRTNWAAKEYRYTDKQTGYTLSNTIVRTRIIVTSGGTTPLKFNVKIQSEISVPNCSNLNPQNDQCFEAWPRILRKYNDLINEIQRRLQVQ
jgi:hypothetical protein